MDEKELGEALTMLATKIKDLADTIISFDKRLTAVEKPEGTQPGGDVEGAVYEYVPQPKPEVSVASLEHERNHFEKEYQRVCGEGRDLRVRVSNLKEQINILQAANVELLRRVTRPEKKSGEILKSPPPKKPGPPGFLLKDGDEIPTPALTCAVCGEPCTVDGEPQTCGDGLSHIPEPPRQTAEEAVAAGAPLVQAFKKCDKCGAEIPAVAAECLACGECFADTG